MTYYPNCTAECAATPECTVCGKRKHPRGRSVPMAMAGGWCDWDCPGYNQPPEPGHLLAGGVARGTRGPGGVAVTPGPEESVAALALAIARRRGVDARLDRERDLLGHPSPAAMQADRESQGELAAAIATVYRHFGYDDQVFEDARGLADWIAGVRA